MKNQFVMALTLLSLSSASFAQVWDSRPGSISAAPTASAAPTSSDRPGVFIVPEVGQGQDRTGAVVSPGFFGGVRIESIRPFSSFEYAGLEVGDEIVQVNSVPTYDIPSFKLTIAKATGNVQLTVRDNRSGQFRTLYARL